MDDATRCTQITINVPQVNLNISTNPGGSTVTFSSPGSSGTFTTGAAGVVSIQAISYTIPGDTVTITFSKSGYKTLTKQYIVSASTTISETLIPNYVDFTIKTQESPGVTNLYARSYYPDGTASEYVNLGHSWPLAMTHIQVDTVIEFYTCVGGDTAGICAGLNPGLWASITVTPDLAGTTTTINIYVAPPAQSGVVIKSTTPKLVGAGGAGYIVVFLYTNGAYEQYGTVLGTGSSVYSIIRSWPTGTNLRMKFVYWEIVSGAYAATRTKEVSFGTSMPYASTVVMGQDVFFDLPINITTSPAGVEVFLINGQDNPSLGLTPLSNMNGLAGWGETITLEFRRSNYTTIRKSYTFSPGNTNIFETLTPVPVTVPITTTPSGVTVTEIFADGTRGTPINTPTTITAPYNSIVTLEFAKTGYDTVVQDFTFVTGLTISKTMVLTPVEVSFYLASVPIDATVYQETFDGTWSLMGTAPRLYFAQPYRWGSIQRFKFVRSGYNDLIVPVTLSQSLSGTTITSTMIVTPVPEDVRLASITLDKTTYVKGEQATVTWTAKNFGGTASVQNSVWLMVGGVHTLTQTLYSIQPGATAQYTFPIDTSVMPIGTLQSCIQFPNGTTGTGSAVCKTATVTAPAPTTFSFTITSSPIGGSVAYYNTTTSQWTYYSTTAGTPLVITRPISAIGTSENWFVQLTGYTTDSFTLTYTSSTNGTTVTRNLTPVAAANVHVVDGSITTTGTTKVGDTVTWHGTVTNGGTVASLGGHVIQLVLNGTVSGYTTTVGVIPAGQSVAVQVSAVVTGTVGSTISGCLQLKAGT